MNNIPSIAIAKKVIQKAIINELCQKDVVDFYQYNNIIKKIDEDILKLETKVVKKENSNIVVKILI